MIITILMNRGIINFFKNIVNLLKGIIPVIEEVNRKLGLAEGIISKIMREEKEK